MAFCRWGEDSDVYVYDTGDNLECCGCMLSATRDTFNGTFLEMKEHLLAHREAGHKVPDYALSRIEFEMQSKTTVFGREIEQKKLAPPERN